MAAASGVASSCGGSAYRPITLVTGPDVSSSGVRDRLVAEWNARCPRHPVRIVELPPGADGQRSQLVAAEQSGNTSYDVLNLDVTWTAEFAAGGLIRPLADARAEDFLPNVWQTVVWDGRVWAVPFNTDVGLLYYRTDTGLHGPPATWDQLLRSYQYVHGYRAAYATQLTRYEGLTVNALEAVWDSGGDLVGPDGAVVADTGRLDAARRGLENLVHMYRWGDILSSSTSAHEAESLRAFARGDVPYLRGWPYMYQVLEHDGLQPRSQFDVAPLPGSTGPGYSVLGGQNLAVAAHSRQPGQARRLIRFLTGSDSERCLLEGGFAATRRSAYLKRDAPVCPLAPADAAGESGSAAATAGASARDPLPPYADTVRHALDHARARPVTPYYAAFTHRVQVIVSGLLASGSAPPSDGELVRRLREVLQGRG